MTQPESRSDAPKLRRRFILILAVVFSLAGLAASGPPGGTLEGLWRPVEGESRPVAFNYHREQDGAGRISVRLPAGGAFAGEYVRLTADRTGKRSERIFSRWRAEGFDRFDTGPAGRPWDRSGSGLERFRSKHRNQVVATLLSAEAVSIRCSFGLTHPDLGLSGGASGRCQVTDGSTIEVPAPQVR